MTTVVARLFGEELTRRGIAFTRDAETGLHVFQHEGLELRVCLDNLAIQYETDQDPARIARFIDIALGTREPKTWESARPGLLFCLELTDYEERPPLRTSISEQADTVLVHYDDVSGHITWVTELMLASWGVSREEAETAATENLWAALFQAKLVVQDIDGVALGYLETHLPFKTALLLAPNLKDVVSAALGWPLWAIAPDRDFLYMWDARHQEFAERVGAVTVREYTTAPYPLSTEIFQIDDEGLTAIGAFEVPAECGQ